MINCHQLVDFCFDYIEGALPDREQRGFQRHLAQCPDCVTFFETYRLTPQLSRDALATQIPPTVKDAVRTFLRIARDNE